MPRLPEFALQDDFFYKKDIVARQRLGNSMCWDDGIKLKTYDRTHVYKSYGRHPDTPQETGKEYVDRYGVQSKLG